jgi:histidinol-phosphate aminotransferase
MSKFWSNRIKNLQAYVPGEQPKDKKYIKLNTNENPYPPSPKVIEMIKKAAGDDLRLYPDPNCDDLRRELAEYLKLKKEQVFIGNGSDEVLAFSFLAFFNPEKGILFPDITYSFYEVYSALFKIDHELIDLDEKFNIPVEKFKKSNGGILLANPNAPTGKFLPLNSIKKILESNKNSVVIVDEAYVDFGGESATCLINEYPNLLVIQTFSKSRSLAGLRIGFALGHEDLIKGLNTVKNSVNSYTLDRIAQAAAVEAIRDDAYFEETRARVIKTREWITGRLKEIGFDAIESKANFIFISHPNYDAKELFVSLKEKGILVRHFNKPRINKFLRVSIGTDEEMDTFYKVIRGMVAG